MEKRHTIPIQTLIAEYLIQLAEWRRMRYQDDLRDQRNLRSADGIETLAAHVRSLSDEDSRLQVLDRLWRRGEQIEVGQQAAYEIGRFRFFIPETEPDAFLDEMVELARADANEHGQFGGQQVRGDNPWG
jgi:hypothetical protein